MTELYRNHFDKLPGPLTKCIHSQRKYIYCLFILTPLQKILETQLQDFGFKMPICRRKTFTQMSPNTTIYTMECIVRTNKGCNEENANLYLPREPGCLTVTVIKILVQEFSLMSGHRDLTCCIIEYECYKRLLTPNVFV